MPWNYDDLMTYDIFSQSFWTLVKHLLFVLMFGMVKWGLNLFEWNSNFSPSLPFFKSFLQEPLNESEAECTGEVEKDVVACVPLPPLVGRGWCSQFRQVWSWANSELKVIWTWMISNGPNVWSLLLKHRNSLGIWEFCRFRKWSMSAYYWAKTVRGYHSIRPATSCTFSCHLWALRVTDWCFAWSNTSIYIYISYIIISYSFFSSD